MKEIQQLIQETHEPIQIAHTQEIILLTEIITQHLLRVPIILQEAIELIHQNLIIRRELQVEVIILIVQAHVLPILTDHIQARAHQEILVLAQEELEAGATQAPPQVALLLMVEDIVKKYFPSPCGGFSFN